jgi:hypothetical protein
VYNSIGQRFIERQLDRLFFALCAVHLPDKQHDALHHGIYTIFIATQSDAQLQNQLVSLEVADSELDSYNFTIPYS